MIKRAAQAEGQGSTPAGVSLRRVITGGKFSEDAGSATLAYENERCDVWRMGGMEVYRVTSSLVSVKRGTR